MVEAKPDPQQSRLSAQRLVTLIKTTIDWLSDHHVALLLWDTCDQASKAKPSVLINYGILLA